MIGNRSVRKRMNLPEAIRKQKEELSKGVSQETATLMNDAVSDLKQSGILENCLQQGAKAPYFRLEDAHGNLVSLPDFLDKGPVILKFFRGDW